MSTGPWQRWFAWHPVQTEQHGWRWLRTVERALHYPPDIPCAPNSYWVYRPNPYWVYRPTPDNRHETETTNER
ncbi:hypothetical protein [Corynebacterium rhinophilum]|uniref:hypothetical protein n=1 Tax=Corynebacterium rhinophilum TaxID=3050197 RepID=UPI00254CE1EF|nr:hypothetical protein [Corynebacterium sp. MSK189]MDK8673318.1 hypothetical protein [Corynebacterium sp. MSK189]